MRVLLLTLVLMAFCSSSMSAELLICAKSSIHATGCQKGDVLIVRPNGHIWGTAETLPTYIQVSVPDMPYAEAKVYEEPLMEDDGVDAEGNPKQKMLRLRKHYIPTTEVETAKLSSGTLTKTRIQNISSVQQKSLLAVKEIQK